MDASASPATDGRSSLRSYWLGAFPVKIVQKRRMLPAFPRPSPWPHLTSQNLGNLEARGAAQVEGQPQKTGDQIFKALGDSVWLITDSFSQAPASDWNHLQNKCHQ